MKIHDRGIAGTGDDMVGREKSRGKVGVVEIRNNSDVAAFDSGVRAMHQTLNDEDALFFAGITGDDVFFEECSMWFETT